MKKNLIKAFLSLGVLTLVAVSGMTLAQDPYVINIGNMDSYGVLNLGRLVMRNTGGTVGIVLDGGFGSSDYVIKIGQNAGRDDLSKLRVSNICDRNGNNCKRIADLNTGITINGTNGRICVKVSDQEINCNGTVVNKNETLARDSSKVVATVNGTDIKVGLPANPHKEGTITTNGASNPSIQYKEDGSVKGSVQIKGAGDTTVSASNGTITVTSTDKDTKGKTVVSSTQNGTSNTNTTNPFLNYLDNSNGSYAVVNGIQFKGDGYTTVQSTNGGKEIVISSTPGTGLEVHTQGINVLGNASTINNGAVSTTNTNTYLNHVEGSSVMNSLKIQGTNGIETSSASSTLTIKGIAATASNLGLIKIGYSANGKNYPVQLDSNNKAYVNVPRTDNNTTYTAGNGLSLASNVFKASLKNETKSTKASTNNIGNVSDANKLYAVGLDANGYLAVHVPWEGGTSRWNGNASVIYPNSTSTNVAIGTTTNNNYTLNVNGSGRIATKFNVGDNFWIMSQQQRQVYVPGTCGSPRYVTSPTIRYNGTLAFRDDDLLQCANGYTEIGDNGSMGIGGPSESATKLSVYGHTRIYSNASATNRYLDLYYGNGANNILSKWSDIKIGLTGDQEVVGVVLPSAYIYIDRTNIGINKEPVPSTRNGSTHQGYYSPTLQVGGSIQISSEYPISNSTQTNNKMICNQQIEGTIAYYNGNFYGCAKTSTSGIYRWRSLDTSSVAGDSLPAVPPAGGASL